MAKRWKVEYVEVSAKSGDGVTEMFEALPTKIESVKDMTATKAAARGDYAINVVPMDRNNRPEPRECCNMY